MYVDNFEVCHATDYEAIVKLLAATASFAVDGRQVRVWAELLPPTEAIGDACVVPPDSKLTPFNETEIFITVGNSSLGYLNYEAWGEVLGRVASIWPHLVAMQLDDFSECLLGRDFLRICKHSHYSFHSA